MKDKNIIADDELMHALDFSNVLNKTFKEFRNSSPEYDYFPETEDSELYDDTETDIDSYIDYATENPDSTDALTQYKIGCYFNESQYYAKAAEWFRKSADNGNADAQFSLGTYYFKGRGIEEDKLMAVKWFQRAVDQGNAAAQASLGFCYYMGDGVNEDKCEAARLFKLSADQGDSQGQYNLSICYYNGEGVEANEEKGSELLHLAAEQGHKDAKQLLQQIEEEQNK